MLPELLNIPVPESMLANMPASYVNYSEHLTLVEKNRKEFELKKQDAENFLEMGPPAKQQRNRGKKKKKNKKSSCNNNDDGFSMDIVADVSEKGEHESKEMEQSVS